MTEINNNTQIYDLSRFSQLVEPLGSDQLPYNGFMRDSVPFVEPQTGNVVEVKLTEDLTRTARYLTLDVNPISRLFLDDKSESHFNTAGSHFFLHADLQFDRITGLGWSCNQRDAPQELVDSMASDNPVLPPSTQAIITSQLRQKYHDLLSPEYVLGMIDAHGTSGGRLTSLSDFFTLLENADPILRGTIAQFLNDIKSAIAAKIKEDPKTGLFFYTALNLTGIKLSPQEQYFVDQLLINYESITIPDRSKDSKWIDTKDWYVDRFLFPDQREPDMMEVDWPDQSEWNFFTITGKSDEELRKEAETLLGKLMRSEDRHETDQNVVRLYEIYCLVGEDNRFPISYTQLEAFLKKRDAINYSAFLPRIEGEDEEYRDWNLPFPFILQKDEPGYDRFLSDYFVEFTEFVNKNNFGMVSTQRLEAKTIVRAVKEDLPQLPADTSIQKVDWPSLTGALAFYEPDLYRDTLFWKNLLRVASADQVYQAYLELLITGSSPLPEPADELWQEYVNEANDPALDPQKLRKERFEVNAKTLGLKESLSNQIYYVGYILEGELVPQDDLYLDQLVCAMQTHDETDVQRALMQLNDEVLIPQGWGLIAQKTETPGTFQFALYPVRIERCEDREIRGVGKVRTYFISNAISRFPDIQSTNSEMGVPENYLVSISHVNPDLYFQNHLTDEQRKSFAGPKVVIDEINFKGKRFLNAKAALLKGARHEPMEKLFLSSPSDTFDAIADVLTNEALTHENAHLQDQQVNGETTELYPMLVALAESEDPFLTLFEYATLFLHRTQDTAVYQLTIIHDDNGKFIDYAMNYEAHFWGAAFFFQRLCRDLGLLGWDETLDSLYAKDPRAFDSMMKSLEETLVSQGPDFIREKAKEYAREYISMKNVNPWFDPFED